MRFKDVLLAAVVSAFWVAIIDSFVGILDGPALSWSSLVEPIGRLIPMVVILVVGYVVWRVWTAFKAWLRGSFFRRRSASQPL
jgi:hypothetical protein